MLIYNKTLIIIVNDYQLLNVAKIIKFYLYSQFF